MLSVLDGADGVLAGLHAGAVVVDCSTTGAELARTAHTLCARAGVGFVDSPVSGSTVVAARGQLGLMVGGEPGDIARVEAVLRCFGGSLVHVGPTGSGAAAKVAVNALLHTFNTALAECLVTAEAQGVARPMLFSVLANSVLWNTFLDYKREAYVNPDDAAVAFDLATAEKDLGLAVAAVNDAGLGSSLVECVHDIHHQAVSDGYGDARHVRAGELVRLHLDLISDPSHGRSPNRFPKGLDVGIHTYGTNAVDWEQRVDVDRLRTQRLARLRAELEGSSLGAVLAFDFTNIRYMTSTHIGTWAVDKLIRSALLVRGGEPIVWDFGSAAKHHQLYNPWLDYSGAQSEDGHAPHHGATARHAQPQRRTSRHLHPARRVPPARPASPKRSPARSSDELELYGLLDEPLGVDVIELPILFALQAAGVKVVDGQQLFLEARRIKTRDEIGLLTQAASMVDAAYDRLYEFLRPGVRENECVGLVSKVLYDMGSEFVEGVNAISGERCSPHPHVYSDRIVRPGDPAFFDILHSYMGYRTCYYRTFAVGSASVAQRDAYTRCREYMDHAISLVRPAQPPPTSSRCGPRRRSSDSPTRKRRSPCSTGTGSGCRSGRSRSSRGWCRSTTPR